MVSFIAAFDWMKLLGNPLIATVAIVERSISPHIKNQLAWISIPATKVFVMVFLTSIASLPIKLLIIDPITRAINAKLAKFFMMFQIFQR